MLAQEWALAHPDELRTLTLVLDALLDAAVPARGRALVDEMPAAERDVLRQGIYAPGYAEAFEEFSRRHLIRIEPPSPCAARSRRSTTRSTRRSGAPTA